MNISVLLLRVLKPEQCDFLGENRYGAGAVQTIDSTVVLLLRGTVKSALKNPSKWLKIALLRQKDDKVPQERQHKVYLALIHTHIDPYTY